MILSDSDFKELGFELDRIREPFKWYEKKGTILNEKVTFHLMYASDLNEMTLSVQYNDSRSSECNCLIIKEKNELKFLLSRVKAFNFAIE